MAYTPVVEYWWLHEDRTVNGDFYPGVIRYNANRNGNKPRGIVHHIQEGSNWGSWQHFHSVKAGATVFISKQGVIWWLIEERHGPWTNGDVNAPDAFIRELIRLYGADPNDWTLTIEYEGFTGNLPYTEAQYQAGLWLTRQWMAKYNIPVERATIRHGQINSVDRYFCCERPGGPFLTRMKTDLAAGGNVTAPLPSFAAGDTVKATDTLNVRKGASTAFDVGFQIDAGTTVTVAKDSSGQATFDGYDYLWVFIDAGKKGTGWVAAPWLELVKNAPAPAPEPAPTPRTVNFLVPMYVRTTPGFWDKANNTSNVVTMLPAGTTGTVKDGPVTEEGIDFYDVEIPGFGSGWVAKEIVNAIQVK